MSMRAWVLFVLVAAMSSGACRGESAAAFSCATPRDAVATIETRLAGVPAILRVPKTIAKSPIVLWHGFGPPASERALMDALPLDDVPAVKVYLGLPLFGRRAEAGGVDAMKRRQTADMASLVFEPVVAGAAKELPSVLGALQSMDCMARGEKIGVFGFSAGGAAVLYAMAEHDAPIGSAVILNASTGLSASVAAYEHATGKPYAWTDNARELARRTDAAGRARDIAAGHPPPALLIVQGTGDATLTPGSAIALHDALKPLYAPRDSQRLQLKLADGMTHNVTDAGSVGDLRKWVAAWFNDHLDAAPRKAHARLP